MKLSIIIPVYNAENTIKRCIDSVLAQKFTDWELIIIDDGSTDTSADIINSYIDDRIIYQKIKNSGVSVARNTGLSMCSGDYIGFIDADDYILDNIFENVVDVLSHIDVDLLKFAHFAEYGKTRRLYSFSTKTDEVIEGLEIQNILQSAFNNADFSNIWNCFFKHSVIGDTVFDTNIIQGEDRKFCYTCLSKAKSIYILSKPGYVYVQNPKSVTHDTNIISRVLSATEVNTFIYELINDDSVKSAFISNALNDFRLLAAEGLHFKNYSKYQLAMNQLYQSDINFLLCVNKINKIAGFDFTQSLLSKSQYLKAKKTNIYLVIKNVILKNMS